VRLQKARIRREVLGLQEQREQIDKLYVQFLPIEKPVVKSKADKPKKKKEEKVENKKEKPKEKVSSKVKVETKK